MRDNPGKLDIEKQVWRSSAALVSRRCRRAGLCAPISASRRPLREGNSELLIHGHGMADRRETSASEFDRATRLDASNDMTPSAFSETSIVRDQTPSKAENSKYSEYRNARISVYALSETEIMASCTQHAAPKNIHHEAVWAGRSSLRDPPLLRTYRDPHTCEISALPPSCLTD